MAEEELQAVGVLEAVGQPIEFMRRDVGDRTATLAHGSDRASTGPPVGRGPWPR